MRRNVHEVGQGRVDPPRHVRSRRRARDVKRRQRGRFHVAARPGLSDGARRINGRLSAVDRQLPPAVAAA